LLELNDFAEKAVDNNAPEAALSLAAHYWTGVQNAVEKTGGVAVVSPDGSVVADWGGHSTTGDDAHDALNAVRAALIFRLSLLELNKKRLSNGQNALRAVCGFSTGKTVTAEHITGGKLSRAFSDTSLWGGGAALAFRAREAAERNGIDIVISSKTWRLIDEYIIAEEIEAPREEEGRFIRLFAVINLRAKQKAEQPEPVTLSGLQSLLEDGKN
jgi:class 3 adenylate cyclase